jgi:2-succinyl-6-hydroxy-2,4-cyclohexadiene-1-carboxylate synthase
MLDKYIHVESVKYHIVAGGTGDPLLLLHGFTGSATSWDAHIPVFAKRCTVIAVDLLGHGETDSPADHERYGIDSAARDINSILENLNLPLVHLLGYSMGGRLALYFALTYPQRVKSLILESAAPGIDSPQERAARIASDNALADRIEHDGIAVFVDEWEKLPLFTSQGNLPANILARQREIRLKQNTLGLANSLRGMGTGVQPPLWNRLEELKTPVLLITGALDQKFTAINQQMREKLLSTNHIVIPDAGHTPHLEQLSNFQQVVSKFIE